MRTSRSKTSPAHLDRESLEQIRHVVSHASEESDARKLPLSPLIALSEGLPALARVTIDVSASQAIGAPLVVLQTPVSPHPAPDESPFVKLSPREQEVAELIALGLPNRDIAERLCLTLGTVKDHVHHVLSKTGFPNRAGLAAAWSRRPGR